MSLVFKTILNFFDLAETRLGDLLGLRDRLALLVVE